MPVQTPLVRKAFPTKATLFATAALMIGALAVAQPASATTISNAAQADTTIYEFGSPDTTTYGQSFLSPGGSLQSFSFTLSGVSGGDARFVLAPISGTTPGAALYASPDFAVQNGVNTISGINTATIAGDEYIGYFTVAGVGNPAPGTISFAGTSSDTYADGQFLYLNSNGADPTGQAFTPFYIPDTAFTAVFGATPVPEPASLALLGAGIAALGLTRRRRKTA